MKTRVIIVQTAFFILITIVLFHCATREGSMINNKRDPRKAALLYSESQKLFARMNSWTGGPLVYEQKVLDLQAIINENVMDCELISEEDIQKGELTRYRALYIVDTLALMQKSVDKIIEFVQNGGFLVALGDFGRNIDGFWKQPWDFQSVFGLTPLAIDRWGTSVSDNTNIFQKADLKKNEPLIQGLKDIIHFGRGTKVCWVTVPDKAVSVAFFPSYLSTVSEKTQLIKEQISALSLNQFGKGSAVFFSALPGGRREPFTDDIKKVISNTRYYIIEP
ncbi:MAG: hypothetical protein JW827_00790 [Spirochaetes bacterium]|nr:hypothetical protein [Spirochaetota bacterium]